MGERLKGKVAIVTGSGRGIGRAEAIALAAEGASVVVNDRGVARDGTGADSDPAETVVTEIMEAGGNAIANSDDITSLENGRKIVRQALAAFGRLDILVNNAGIQINRSVFDITEDEFDRTLAIHLKGHWSMIRASLDVFREQRSGCIINTASMAGLGQMRHVDYCAAKEGIVGMTRALALELTPFNIRVNDIRPRGMSRMITDVRPEERLPLPGFEAQPQGGPGGGAANRDPAMVGAMVAFLASDAAAGITGKDFFVQGDQISLLSMPARETTLVHDGGWDPDTIERLFAPTFSAATRPPVPY